MAFEIILFILSKIIEQAKIHICYDLKLLYKLHANFIQKYQIFTKNQFI